VICWDGIALMKGKNNVASVRFPEPPYSALVRFRARPRPESSRCSFGAEWFRMVKEGAGNLDG